MGPSLQFHLGGGTRGIQHFMEHLLPVMDSLWKVLGTPSLTPEFKQRLAEGVQQEAAGRSVAKLAETENAVLVGLLRLRADHG
jgi:hypothetical protein